MTQSILEASMNVVIIGVLIAGFELLTLVKVHIQVYPCFKVCYLILNFLFEV